MNKIIKSIAFILLAGTFTGCKKNELLPNYRTFYMGFTPLPYDFDDIAKSVTYDFIKSHGDIIAHHIDPYGVPWEEAFTGTDFPKDVEQEIQYRITHSPKNKKIFLSVTALALDRTSVNDYWGENIDEQTKIKWKNKSFKDAELVTAYLNYCRRMISYFQPDYFAYMIEANFAYKKTDSTFNYFLNFCDTVYHTLKTEYPYMPIIATLTSGALNNTSIEDMWDVNKALVPYTDMIAVSSYPYMLGTPSVQSADPVLIRDDWLKKMHALDTKKPFAVSETAYLAENFEIPGIIYYRGSENWQYDYINLLMKQADELNAEFIIWFVPFDLDRGIGILETFGITDADPFATKAWENTGLVDGNNVPRMGLKAWDNWYELMKIN